MEKEVLIKFIVVLLLATLISCQSKTKEERWRSQAVMGYLDFRLWEDAKMMNSIEFVGPIKCDSTQINGFIPRNNSVIYGWYHTHKLDTFWIYSEVIKTIENKNIIHTSTNYHQLGLNWKDWLDDEN